jgi:hypothetical protein
MSLWWEPRAGRGSPTRGPFDVSRPTSEARHKQSLLVRLIKSLTKVEDVSSVCIYTFPGMLY